MKFLKSYLMNTLHNQNFCIRKQGKYCHYMNVCKSFFSDKCLHDIKWPLHVKKFSSANLKLSEKLGDVSTEDLKHFVKEIIIHMKICHNLTNFVKKIFIWRFTVFLCHFSENLPWSDPTSSSALTNQALPTAKYLISFVCDKQLASPLLPLPPL